MEFLGGDDYNYWHFYLDQKGGQIPLNSLNWVVYWDWVNSLQKGFSCLTRALTLSSLCDFQTFFFFSSRTHLGGGGGIKFERPIYKKNNSIFNWHNTVYKFKFVVFTLIYVCVLSHSVMSDSLQSHDCILPGSSVHEDSPGKKARVGCHALLQGIFPTRDRTQVSCIAGRLFIIWATREAHLLS